MFTNVIVGVDGRRGGREAIALATKLSTPGSTIRLAHFYGAGNPVGRTVEGRSAQYRRSKDILAREAATANLDARLLSLSGAEVGRGLHQLADTKGSDLIVVGSCRHGPIGRVFLGNDTRDVLTNPPCPVAIAPAGYIAPSKLSRIGVGYDGSPESLQAVNVARVVAHRYGGSVSALCVVSLQDIPYGEPIADHLPDAARQLVTEEHRRVGGLADVIGDLAYGDPGEELAAFSTQLDLLIVGSRCRGLVDRLFERSTAAQLARRATSPLLVMPRSAGVSRWSGSAALAHHAGF